MLRKLISLLLFLLLAECGFAQWSKFVGDWQGKVTMGDGRTLKVRFKITGEDATQYSWNSTSESWYVPQVTLAKIFMLNDNLVYLWMNKGEVWTESQVFMLSYTNTSKLYLVWSRQVVNSRSGQESDFWCEQGEGSILSY
jgi:hypothetical protein